MLAVKERQPITTHRHLIFSACSLGCQTLSVMAAYPGDGVSSCCSRGTDQSSLKSAGCVIPSVAMS